MRIAILDIGTRNTALIVERIPNISVKTLIHKYGELPLKSRIVEGRMHNPKVQDMINEYTKSCSTILLKLFDPNCGSKVGLTNTTRINLHNFLQKYIDILKTCDYIAIEEQFYSPQTGTINKPALLLAESVYTWFIINGMEVEYTPSKLKTAILGCPKESLMVDKSTGLRVLKKWEKAERKKWSVQVAKFIYMERDDSRSLEILSYIESRKGDDVSDCLLMSIAFVLKKFVM